MRSKMTLYLSLMSPRVLLTSSSSRNRSASAPSSPAHPWSNAESLSPASSSPAPPSESRGVGESSARGEPRSSASISYAESATTGSRGVGGVGPRDAPRDASAPGAAVVAESPARRSMSRRLRAEGGGGEGGGVRGVSEGEGGARSEVVRELGEGRAEARCRSVATRLRSRLVLTLHHPIATQHRSAELSGITPNTIAARPASDMRARRGIPRRAVPPRAGLWGRRRAERACRAQLRFVTQFFARGRRNCLARVRLAGRSCCWHTRDPRACDRPRRPRRARAMGTLVVWSQAHAVFTRGATVRWRDFRVRRSPVVIRRAPPPRPGRSVLGRFEPFRARLILRRHPLTPRLPSLPSPAPLAPSLSSATSSLRCTSSSS